MQQIDIIQGTIERFLFQNQDNGYSVFIVAINEKKKLTVTGHVPHVHAGEYVIIHGTWTMHPKFGKQFQAQKTESQVPTSIHGIEKYLSSGLIKGIGPVYAKKMVAHFGAQILDIIDQTPERLSEIDGIGHKRLDVIIAAWANQKEISRIMVFLQEKGVSTTYATKIYKKYGQSSIAVVQENPYRLADDIWGIGFKTADTIAHAMGFSHESIYRITSGIIYTLNTYLGNGHVYCELNQLKQETVKLLTIDPVATQTKITHALHQLYQDQKIKLVSYNDDHLITLSAYYFSEKGIAHKLKTLQKNALAHTININAVYTQLRTQKSSDTIVCNNDQQQAIIGALQEKVSIITGGPGTGKTTVIKQLLTIFDQHKISYLLAAPTGRAAKRMTESTGRPAKTIHRLLEFDPSVMNFTRNEQNALITQVLVIDEASMIDIFLAHAILKATPLTAQIIFIGDSDQLPSVGAGNFLADLITSDAIPVMRLTEIFRQAQDSLIIMNAHRVNHGEFPQSSPDARRDFIFIKEQNPEHVPAHLQKIFRHGLATHQISADNSTVLVPMNRGGVGTQKLNHDLQQLLNPEHNAVTVSHAGATYKIGDRVLQTRNNYDKLIFNGDVGTITAIVPQDHLITIDFYGRSIEYEYTEIDELTHAYALTIHKSQGSEYDAVIIPIFMQHFTLLARNLIYTAITRAKKLCIIIGQPKALAMAIKNNKKTHRLTLLKEFLTTDLTAR